MREYGRRIPVDPKVIKEIQRSPKMRAEQGVPFMQSWGGPQRYQQMARLPTAARVVYYSLQEGVPQDQISVVTGLTPGEVEEGIARLSREGLLE